MRALDYTFITDCSQVRHIDRGPYHYYPDSGEVYDAIGNYLGTGIIQQGILIVTPDSSLTSHNSHETT